MRVDILDFIPKKHHDDLRNGVSTFDCADAVDRAIASSDHPTNHPSYRAGPAVYFPHGVYPLSRPIRLRRRTALVGEGSGFPYGEAAILKFGPGSGGVVVEWFDGPEEGKNTGAGSIIRGLALLGDRRGDGAVHGVILRGRALIAETVISGFPGDGVHIAADIARTDAMRGNANGWRITGVRIDSCGGNGLFVEGDDANAGLAEIVDCSNNGQWGVLDKSFLGNTYIACHVDANKLGAYASTGENARNVFIGCYSEDKHPGSSIRHPALVVGGLHAAGFSCGTTAPVISVSAEPTLTVSTGVESAGEANGTRIAARLGGAPSNGDVLSMTANPETPLPWRLRFAGPDLFFDWANLDAARPFIITGPRTNVQFGRGEPVPWAMVLQDAFIGRGESARRHGSGDAAPTAGRHGRGDIVWNNAPGEGGFAGWICVEGGAPGVWRPFGAIA